MSIKNMQRETLVRKRFILSTLIESIRESIFKIDQELQSNPEIRGERNTYTKAKPFKNNTRTYGRNI